MPPNILFIFSDQQRWDTCGCYGQPLNLTPSLDRMAAEGVRFEHAFTCQPVCGPARACLQTGRYASELACPTNHCRLPTDAPTIADALSARGYATGYIGKWHLASFGPENGPDDFRTKPVPHELRGGYKDFWLASDVLEFTSHSYDGHMFDTLGRQRNFPAGRYRADAQTDWALECLGEFSKRQPFFLFVSYIEPHHQNDHGHYEGPRGSKERFKNFVPPGDLAGTKGDWQEEYPDYLGCISSLDENVGRLLAELDHLGISENTLVFYTSDHGSHFRTRNSEYKRACHDGCIRIPMLARGPGFRGGRVVPELVSLIDLPSTILAAADAEPLPLMRGLPLQPLTQGDASARRPEVFLQISESQCGRAIRTPEWTYSVRAPDKPGNALGSECYVEDFLYDNRRDPHQRHNLAREPELASLRADLAATLIERMLEAGEARPEIRPAPECE